MILGFCGTVGSGKTLSMTEQAYRYHQQGLKIYANYGLSFEHEVLTKKRFNELIEDQEELQDCVILLDEIQIWLDSRASMGKKRRIITYFLLQTRKRNVRLLYTTQFFHQIDKRLRDVSDIVVYCTNMTDKSSLVNDDKQIYLMRESYRPAEMGALDLIKREVIHANPLFKLYDTRQMVSFLDED